ncbi:MAG: phosphatase PAP2 family protein [Gemmatimonadota bacterium]
MIASPNHIRSLIRVAGLTAALAIVELSPVLAQVPDTTKKPTPRDSAIVDTLQARAQRKVLREAHQIRLTDAALAVGGVAVLSLLDEPLQRASQKHRRSHRGGTLTDLANGFRQQGEPIYYAGISLGVLATGYIVNSAPIRRAGRRLVVSVAASALVEQTIKITLGRSRPNEGVGAFSFHPFSSRKDSTGLTARGSMPSGHVTAAFAVATSLADDIHNTPVKIALYTLASGTAFSRIYDNRHWFSDTAAGAILGITTAKLVSGHWRLFGLKPPGWLVTPTGAPALSWNVPFSTSPSVPHLATAESSATR